MVFLKSNFMRKSTQSTVEQGSKEVLYIILVLNWSQKNFFLSEKQAASYSLQYCIPVLLEQEEKEVDKESFLQVALSML